MSERILITEAAGTIGTMLRPRMTRPQRFLRLLDIAPIRQAQPGEQVETSAADITDLDAIRHAGQDVDAISANTRNRFSLDEARASGYRPQDDAESYADELPPPSVSDVDQFVGGPYCE
jgi:nucleoside-diphosphate-sugar epimerase